MPFATVGAVLPGDFTIKARKMRGVDSHGMLCSAKELGFGTDHAGIWLLEDGLPLGAPLREALGLEPDVLYDLEINPNRPDAMSVAGVARDVAARLGVPFVRPEPAVVRSGDPVAGSASVEILDADLCGRFHASILRGVTVGDSPQWMANRLIQLGMRPINALVDISNYVMLELGQPNHPYDLAKVPGAGLRVRRAGAGETLVTLDDVERHLLPDDLLICAADDTPVGIAGVMGGASCEIDASTTDVLSGERLVPAHVDQPHAPGGSDCAPRPRPASRRGAIPRSSSWRPTASHSLPPRSAARAPRPVRSWRPASFPIARRCACASDA